ncbi:MAG: hypothetical protein KatS3mg035_0180 [Bacteroidia bacterium]|nr:MAG: hypothetical protein KatS3mg035_0180 [Bacteroidia bacterium]
MLVFKKILSLQKSLQKNEKNNCSYRAYGNNFYGLTVLYKWWYVQK